MKTSSNLNLPRARTAGFTLVEIYVVSVIGTILVLAITAMQFFAAHVYTLAATKLTSTASGRKAMNDMRDAIRGADEVEVVIYDPVSNTFTNLPEGTPQIGNAIAVFTNNPNGQNTSFAYIYFMNPQASNVCSVIYSNNAVMPSTLVVNIANFITNYYAFDAEDCFTNILTNYVNNRVIHIKFQYCQWEFPLAGVAGQNAMYDYYQLQTRAIPAHHRLLNPKPSTHMRLSTALNPRDRGGYILVMTLVFHGHQPAGAFQRHVVGFFQRKGDAAKRTVHYVRGRCRGRHGGGGGHDGLGLDP